MGKHSIQAQRVQTTKMERIGQAAQYVAKHAKHPISHIVTLISLHAIALTILEKTPILVLFGIH